MNEHDELMNFFEVLTTLRNEYARSNNRNKVDMISVLAQVAVDVIKCGKIPSCFELKKLDPYNKDILIKPVKELFSRLSVELTIFDEGISHTNKGKLYHVTFATVPKH